MQEAICPCIIGGSHINWRCRISSAQHADGIDSRTVLILQFVCRRNRGICRTAYRRIIIPISATRNTICEYDNHAIPRRIRRCRSVIERTDRLAQTFFNIRSTICFQIVDCIRYIGFIIPDIIHQTNIGGRRTCKPNDRNPVIHIIRNGILVNIVHKCICSILQSRAFRDSFSSIHLLMIWIIIIDTFFWIHDYPVVAIPIIPII